MSCEVASWIPTAVAATLCAERGAPVLAWLTSLRASIEEYDPLVTVRPPSLESDSFNGSPVPDCDSEPQDDAFDDILSQLGTEIYKLDEYQKYLGPNEAEVSLSILNIFDECLDEMAEVRPLAKIPVDECSDGETSLSDVSFVTSTPVQCAKVADVHGTSDKVSGAPIPPPRARLKTSSCSLYDNIEFKPKSDSDSESTCWSYKECSDAEPTAKDAYARVWSHSTGFHNSDEIIRHVLSQNRATVSRLSFDTASEFATDYHVYSLREVGDADRCSVAAMTPDRPADDGYEPVRDAITDENIYEEIEYGYSYTDEGCSCGTSIEVESCSMSASSEGVGRESPLYANLRDHDAYAVTPDVIYWKNLLLDPFYNDDEEDEWITPEECAAYTRDQRPPLVIPRITQYRTPRRDQRPALPFQEDSVLKSSKHKYDRQNNWSPSSEPTRADMEHSFGKAHSDSPPNARVNKRLGGSTENLLEALRRPNHLNLPASSSGDSIEFREEHGTRSRKSRSMMVKPRMQSPVPPPRMTQHAGEATFIMWGPAKRTKFFENGKKCKKNWNDCFMILTPTALVFYKDQKTYEAYLASVRKKPSGTPPSPSMPVLPNMVLALRDTRILQCKPEHTRRYTRSLLLLDYNQYLIQLETEKEAQRWLQAIQKLYNLPPLPTEYMITPPYQSSSTDLESLGRTPPASRHANRTKQKAGGSSNEDLSDSTEVSIQKSHVRSRLRKFFAKRPAMEVLVKKGIYKDEPVFGRNLELVCPTTSPCVPEFVVAVIKEIESSEDNMCTDGLYRASGNLSQVQKIRLEIDQNNQSVIENNSDIHVLTGSLKLFFRELKEPLIPWSVFAKILAACSLKPKEVKIKEFRDIVQSLPLPNRDTLKFLLEHLLKVTQRSEKNRMHTANLAIIFGPTLLWAPVSQANNYVDCIQQNHVVEILLKEFNEIFAEDPKTKKKS